MTSGLPSEHRWRITELLREATANTTTSGSVMRWMLGVSILVGSALSAVSFLDWQRLDTEVAAFHRSGGTTLMIAAAPLQGGSQAPGNAARIDTRSCLELSRVTGVEEVFTVHRVTEDQFREFGTLKVSRAVVGTDGSTERPPPGLFAGSALAERLVDTSVVTPLDSDEPQHLTGTAPWTLDQAGFGQTMATIVDVDHAPTMSDQCIARVTLDTLAEAPSRLPAALRIESLEITSQFVKGAGDRSPYSAFAERATRNLPLLLGVLYGLIYSLALRSRSSEIGLYRVTGTRRVDVMVMLGFEYSILVATAMCSALLAAVMLQAASSYPVVSSLPRQYLLLGPSTIIAAIAAGLRSRSDVQGLLKER